MSRFFGATSVTSRSPIKTAPSVTSSRPAMQRSSVVFPHPEGPTSTMNSPSSIFSETPSTARTPFGNSLRTSWRSMAATGSALHAGRDDAAGELLLHQEEEDQRRNGVHERCGQCLGRRQDRLLARRLVVAEADLR